MSVLSSQEAVIKRRSTREEEEQKRAADNVEDEPSNGQDGTTSTTKKRKKSKNTGTPRSAKKRKVIKPEIDLDTLPDWIRPPHNQECINRVIQCKDPDRWGDGLYDGTIMDINEDRELLVNWHALGWDASYIDPTYYYKRGWLRPAEVETKQAQSFHAGDKVRLKQGCGDWESSELGGQNAILTIIVEDEEDAEETDWVTVKSEETSKVTDVKKDWLVLVEGVLVELDESSDNSAPKTTTSSKAMESGMLESSILFGTNVCVPSDVLMEKTTIDKQADVGSEPKQTASSITTETASTIPVEEDKPRQTTTMKQSSDCDSKCLAPLSTEPPSAPVNDANAPQSL